MTKQQAIDIMASCAVYVVEKVEAPWDRKAEICEALKMEKDIKALFEPNSSFTDKAKKQTKIEGNGN